MNQEGIVNTGIAPNEVKSGFAIEGYKIAKAVATCTTLAENNSNDTEKLINVKVDSEGLILSTTDGSRELHYAIKMNTFKKDEFTVNAKKLKTITTDDSDLMQFTIRGSDILVSKNDTQVQLKKYEYLRVTKLGNIKFQETVKLSGFVKQLACLIPNIPDDAIANYILISDGLMSVRQTLMYAITEVPSLTKTYVLDSFTAKLLLSICRQGLHNEESNAYFYQDVDGAYTIVKVGTAYLKFATIQSSSVDLKTLASMKKLSGKLVSKDNIIKSLNNLVTLTGTLDVDIKGRGKTVRISPTIEEFSDTHINTKAIEILEKPNDDSDFLLTTNLAVLVKTLRSFISDYAYFVSSYSNMLVVVDKSELCTVRYFISVI